MGNLGRNAPPIAVALASLLVWVSFAWGMPTEGSATEGDAAAAAEDPWARVRLSAAYDYAKCTECGKKNEIRAESCSRCGYELIDADAEATRKTAARARAELRKAAARGVGIAQKIIKKAQAEPAQARRL